jgi:hypothetical protein
MTTIRVRTCALIIFAFLLTCLPVIRSFGRQEGSVAYPCAAFALDGRSATGDFVARALHVTVTNTAGMTRVADLPLEDPPGYCRLFFPSHANYLVAAVGFVTESKYWFRIGMLDTDTRKWISTLNLEPRRGTGSRFDLEGFLKNSSDLVFSEYGSNEIGLSPAPTLREILTPDGKVDRPTKFAATWGFVDSRHNRLWLYRDPHPCPLRSVTLIGDPAEGPTINEKALGALGCGDGLVLLAFPDQDTVLGTAARSDGDWVWRADLASGQGQQLKLPQAKEAGTIRTDSDVEGGSSSPDGQVFAVARTITAWDADKRPHEMPGEIAVTEVKPLRLLGIVKPKSGCPRADAFSVDHRNGQATVLAHWCGTWERIHLPDTAVTSSGK